MPHKDPAVHREYQRRRKAARRAKYTDGVVCVQCGSTERINWHHVDPDTKISHRIWTWSTERLEAELAKCTPLCGLCHTRYHCATPVPHGTHSGYAKHGCRCRECKDAQAAYQREWKANRTQSDRARFSSV